MIARRTMLGGVALPLLAGRVAAGTIHPTADWASGIVHAYDAQGYHRTGQLADLEDAEWLAREASALGASVAIEEFSIDRVEPATCHLEVDGRRIPGVPMFDAAFTGPDGVTGRLGTGPGAEVGLATLGPLSIYGSAYEPYRRAPGSRALVTVTEGGKDGLALFNAEHFLEPYGVPDLLVASGHGPALSEAAARGAVVRVVADVRRVPSPVRNVVATVAGRAPSARPVVVMTPRNGWWHCASERGGGLACWLAVLAALWDVPPAATVTLVASSGHELGHIGLDDFMAKRPPLVNGATWLHFGANIGAAGSKLNLQSPNEDLRALGTRELQAAGRLPFAAHAGAFRRVAGHPPRRRALPHLHRQQRPVPPRRGPLAPCRRSRGDGPLRDSGRPDRHRLGRLALGVRRGRPVPGRSSSTW